MGPAPCDGPVRLIVERQYTARMAVAPSGIQRPRSAASSLFLMAFRAAKGRARKAKVITTAETKATAM
ncbi:Uncharacterised protein [Mycobacteroides abscessus subsp. massiliense]|nr:Uncharacterised protein [Mycobacteroides abscessus subsp. massiliense]